jgi:hypothetical protein
MPPAMPQVRAGKLRAHGDDDHALACGPEIPTMIESRRSGIRYQQLVRSIRCPQVR